jgi:hypothetical protein
MMMRARRPLLRGAVVGGAGYMAGKSAAKHAGQEQSQEARLDSLEQQQAQAAPPAAPAPDPAPAPAAGGLDAASLDQLKQLGELHASGVLSDDEFAAAKKKLLGL